MQKGFIPIVIAIIIGVFVIGGAGYVGVKQYQKSQSDKIVKEKRIEEALKQAQEEIEQLKLEEDVSENKEISDLIKKRESEIAALRKDLGSLKNKAPEVIIQTVIKEVQTPKAEPDLSSIINQWKNKVAEVTCDFHFSDGSTIKNGGSATIVNNKWPGTVALTNRHVVVKKGLTPTTCLVKIYESGERRIYSYDLPFHSPENGDDWAYVELSKIERVKENDVFANVSEFEICKVANVGDKIVVLGFPTIGTEGGITATEGIISGIEKHFYVTSAKIEHGNSGGTAILVKDNCFLGVPTEVQVGTIESLGRILSGKYILDSSGPPPTMKSITLERISGPHSALTLKVMVDEPATIVVNYTFQITPDLKEDDKMYSLQSPQSQENTAIAIQYPSWNSQTKLNFSVRAIDIYGNRSKEESYSVLVNTIPGIQGDNYANPKILK